MSELTDRRRYTNGAAESSLSVTIDAAVTSFTLSTTTGFPLVPFTATLDYQGPTEEVVLVTGLSGLTVTNCVRGYDGSAAQSHSLGSTFVHTLIAADADEANDHTSSTAGHGTTGDVVGTTDVQTLTHKTISTSVGLATTVDPAAKLQAAATGTASQLEAYDSAGTGLLARIGRAGDLFVTPNLPTVKPLVLKAANAQTANIMDIQTNTASPLWIVDSKGRIIHRPSDLTTPAVKHVPPSAAAATFLALRDTGDTTDLFVLTAAGEITTAAKVWLRGTGADDPIRFPVDGSKFSVDVNGNLMANNAGGRVNSFKTVANVASSGSVEVMGHSHPYAVVTGRRYRFEVAALVNAGADGVNCVVRARFAVGAVTNGSTLIEEGQSGALTVGSVGRATVRFFGEFVASSTGNINIALGSAALSGASDATIISSMVALDCVGL